MDRRTFIGAFAGGLVIARSVAEAQPAAKVYRIGFLSLGKSVQASPGLRMLKDELRVLGYVEGRNIAVSRWSGSALSESRYGDFALNIVALAPDLIVTNSSRLTLAFKAATTTARISSLVMADPGFTGFQVAAASGGFRRETARRDGRRSRDGRRRGSPSPQE